MKILISAYTIDPEKGSEPFMAWQWIHNAVLFGHEVHVLTTKESGVKLKKKIEYDQIKDLAVYEISAPKLPRLFGSEINMYLTYILWQLRIPNAIRTNNLGQVDLAHHTSWGNIGLGSGFAFMNIPFLYGPLGGGVKANPKLKFFFSTDWNKERIRMALQGLYIFSPIARLSAKRATLVLATNNDTSKLAKKLGAKDVRLVLADAIMASEITEETQCPTDLTAVFIARFLHRKGANLALMAFARTLIEFPDSHFLMVGDGPTLASTKILATKLGISENVEFRGMLPWSEVQQILKNTRVCVFSSLRDNFGAQVLEAAAKGVPVVVLEGGGASEWMHHHGIAVAAIGTTEQTVLNLSSCISQFFRCSESEWLRQSMSQIYFAKSHTIESKARVINDFYYEIGGKHTG